MSTVALAVPMADAFERLVAKIERHGSQLSRLSAGHEMATRRAYRQARRDIEERLTALIESRVGGVGGGQRSGRVTVPPTIVRMAALSVRDRYRLSRDARLIGAIEGRLSQLGAEHTSILNRALSETGNLAVRHLAVEMAEAVKLAGRVPGRQVIAAIDFARLDFAVIEAALGSAVNDVRALTAATRQVVTREIQAGVAQGQGVRGIMGRLRVLNVLSRNRAELITRHAVIKGYNTVRLVAYEEASEQISGLKKMWLTQADERACPECLALQGTVVEIPASFDADATFRASGNAPEVAGDLETPPRHPRCRCSITSWHDSWAEFTDKTPEALQDEAQAEWAGVRGGGA